MVKKNIVFSLLVVLLTGSLFAQEAYNKWSIGFNLGAHDGASPTKIYTRLYQIHHYSLNGRYMLNNRFGLRAMVGYDFFDPKKSGKVNVHYWRVSFSMVANAGDILKFHTFSEKLGLLTHAGFGASTLFLRKSIRPTISEDDPFFEGQDDMLNFAFGITPQFKLNDRVSINADATCILHHLQTRYFDWSQSNVAKPINGYFFNYSLGVTLYLGKNKTHLDWVPTDFSDILNENNEFEKQGNELEKRVQELEEKSKDDDKDGVPNVLDCEPNTPPGAVVDSKGQAMVDSDGDGILDVYDSCPTEKGLMSTNGCPDSDGDGVPDVRDKCPDVPGISINAGCPEVAEVTKVIMRRALKNVQFYNNKAVLLESSYGALDDVVKELNDHPEYNLLVEGHTDDVGLETWNMTLSENRANAIEAYLISKGIDPIRIITKAYGETRPVASNKTKEGRAQNRRVEFKIVF
ncbi:MAG: OmpA family protein [Fluviicola sp.]|jgi:OOP family OmpA-OmpF porin